MRVRQMVPLPWRSRYREWQRERERSQALKRGLRALGRDPTGSDEVFRDLVKSWGGWAASPDFLQAAVAAARTQTGPILECGSGLTTLVLATVANRAGAEVWSLEHDSHWYEVTAHALRRSGLEANLRLAPLRDYGAFDWYEVAGDELPLFSLVICDGPPNSTRGGRYGLVPVLGDRLASDCIVLLDDAERPGEQEVLRRWSSESSLSYEVQGGGDRRFAAVTRSHSELAHSDRRAGPVPARSRGHRPARIGQRGKLRAPWVGRVAFLLVGLISFAVTSASVEVFTDRDWQLSGFEWPADFMTAALLVCLVPLLLIAVQRLIGAERRDRTMRQSQSQDGA